MDLFATAEVFSSDLRGKAIRLTGCDEGGHDISGTYVVTDVSYNVINLVGLSDSNVKIVPRLELEWFKGSPIEEPQLVMEVLPGQEKEEK
jgi:hypothetical protein